jgi:hypothetical protein
VSLPKQTNERTASRKRLRNGAAATIIKKLNVQSFLLTALSVGISIALLAWLFSYFFARAAAYPVLAPPQSNSVPLSCPEMPLCSPLDPKIVPQPIPPILERIAACESMGDVNAQPRQFQANGDVLWGSEEGPDGKTITVKRDVGEFQINTWAHADELKALGLDVIHSQADNIKYALMLYARNGTADWVASQDCWK